MATKKAQRTLRTDTVAPTDVRPDPAPPVTTPADLGELASAVRAVTAPFVAAARAVAPFADGAAAAAGATAGATTPVLTEELNNIDFRKMIGGPLQAAVDAQVASSLATVDFITKVGFRQPVGADGEPDPEGRRELVMVDFSHTRDDGEVDGAGKPVVKAVTVRVPLLAMLPIPSLRIEHVIIDFNAKLNSVQTSSVADELGVQVEGKAGWGPVSFKVTASYQRKTSTNVEVKKEYSLAVNVKAVQDEIPPGLEKVLTMLAA